MRTLWEMLYSLPGEPLLWAQIVFYAYGAVLVSIALPTLKLWRRTKKQPLQHPAHKNRFLLSAGRRLTLAGVLLALGTLIAYPWNVVEFQLMPAIVLLFSVMHVVPGGALWLQNRRAAQSA